jgi:hypothetical protein
VSVALDPTEGPMGMPQKTHCETLAWFDCWQDRHSIPPRFEMTRADPSGSSPLSAGSVGRSETSESPGPGNVAELLSIVSEPSAERPSVAEAASGSAARALRLTGCLSA